MAQCLQTSQGETASSMSATVTLLTLAFCWML